MSNYRKIWENFHGCKLSKDLEIHHIDGNRKNNNPENLLAVTINQHLEIHFEQKDYGAVQAILMRMKKSKGNKQFLSECASKHQIELLQDGKHNFQKFSKERRKEISAIAGLLTKQKNIGIHRINADPILSKINARKGGLASKAKKTGFHDPDKTGSKFVKNTHWWKNELTGERKRCVESPGDNWNKGMK